MHSRDVTTQTVSSSKTRDRYPATGSAAETVSVRRARRWPCWRARPTPSQSAAGNDAPRTALRSPGGAPRAFSEMQRRLAGRPARAGEPVLLPGRYADAARQPGGAGRQPAGGRSGLGRPGRDRPAPREPGGPGTERGGRPLVPALTSTRSCSTRPTPSTVVVDPLRIEQVLTNLVDNAVNCQPAGGTMAGQQYGQGPGQRRDGDPRSRHGNPARASAPNLRSLLPGPHRRVTPAAWDWACTSVRRS